MSSEAQSRQIDPDAPFIAPDGLEYDDFADFICQKPIHCARNEHILAHRKAGRSEAALQVWIKAYDGDDPTPSSQIEPAVQNWRQYRADKAYGDRHRSRAGLKILPLPADFNYAV